MTPCNIFGCVIDDENRYSASSMAKMEFHHRGGGGGTVAIQPTPTTHQLGTQVRARNELVPLKGTRGTSIDTHVD